MATDPVESSIVNQVFLEASGIGTRLREGFACHVLEIGFGVGTTALVTADEALKAGTAFSMVSIENDPVSSAQLRACCHGDWLEHVHLLDRLRHACNPEPWSPALLARLFAALVPDGVLVTYSSRGQLQRDLRSVGFVVERLPGPAGKRMTLRACKPS